MSPLVAFIVLLVKIRLHNPHALVTSNLPSFIPCFPLFFSFLFPLTFRLSHNYYASSCHGPFPQVGKLFHFLLFCLIHTYSDLSSTKSPQESYSWPNSLEQVPAIFIYKATFPFFTGITLTVVCTMYIQVCDYLFVSPYNVSFMRASTMAVLLTVMLPAPHGLSGIL